MPERLTVPRYYGMLNTDKSGERAMRELMDTFKLSDTGVLNLALSMLSAMETHLENNFVFPVTRDDFEELLRTAWTKDRETERRWKTEKAKLFERLREQNIARSLENSQTSS